MTKDDIIGMAREAGLAYGTDERVLTSVLRFTNLVASAAKAEEREECAKLCENLRDEDGYPAWSTECADAIRARAGNNNDTA